MIGWEVRLMKKYNVEFYSNNGYLLGESLSEYKDFSEVEEYVRNIIQKESSIKITSKNSVDFIRVADIAKITITE